MGRHFFLLDLTYSIYIHKTTPYADYYFIRIILCSLFATFASRGPAPLTSYLYLILPCGSLIEQLASVPASFVSPDALLGSHLFGPGSAIAWSFFHARGPPQSPKMFRDRYIRFDALGWARVPQPLQLSPLTFNPM